MKPKIDSTSFGSITEKERLLIMILLSGLTQVEKMEKILLSKEKYGTSP